MISDPQRGTQGQDSGNGRDALRRVGHAAVLGLGVFAGLLMWSRLKIVTDTPRSAYAVPHEAEESQNAASERRSVEPSTQVIAETKDARKDDSPSENGTTP